MKRGISIHDQEQARREAQAAKREQELTKPNKPVKCICGCGKRKVWQNMMYWLYPDESPELPGCYAVDQEHFDKAFDICRWNRG